MILNGEDVLTHRHSQVHFEVLAKQQGEGSLRNLRNYPSYIVI